MIVSVTLKIDVDPAAWTETYGTEGSTIRQDVKTYVAGSVQGSAAADEGCIRNVTVK